MYGFTTTLTATTFESARRLVAEVLEVEGQLRRGENQLTG